MCRWLHYTASLHNWSAEGRNVLVICRPCLVGEREYRKLGVSAPLRPKRMQRFFKGHYPLVPIPKLRNGLLPSWVQHYELLHPTQGPQASLERGLPGRVRPLCRPAGGFDRACLPGRHRNPSKRNFGRRTAMRAARADRRIAHLRKSPACA